MLKTNRILSFILALSMLFCTFLILHVSAEETENGIKFTAEDLYEADGALSARPATVEAVIKFPADTTKTSVSSAIFSNYTTANVICFSLEVTPLGNPRLFIIGNKNATYDYLFKEVSLYTGKEIHLVITLDYATGTAMCYTDGQLKQKIEGKPIPELSSNTKYCIGGDERDGNKGYFKGIIKSLALFSDVRTSEEIALDYTTLPTSDDALLGSYDLSEFKVGNYPKKVECKAGKGVSYIRNDQWFTDKEPVPAYDFSFAVNGDIQSINLHYSDQLHKIFDWIIDNVESKKIKFVFNLGDITDKNTAKEWARAKEQYLKFENIVPYSFVRGNHDGAEEYKNTFPYDEFSKNISGSYDGSMLTTYQEFNAGVYKFLVVNIDMIASDEELEWANKVIEEHPDHNVIVTTHIYMSLSKNYYATSSITKYGAKNGGEPIWNKLLKKHKNIVMIICGHSPTDRITLKTDVGENGNTVQQLLVNPQDTDIHWDGVGLVAMLYLRNDSNVVDVDYYSTVKEKYFLPENQFTFELELTKSEELVEELKKAEEERARAESERAESERIANEKKAKQKTTTGIIIGVVAAVVVIGAGAGIYFSGKNKSKKAE